MKGAGAQGTRVESPGACIGGRGPLGVMGTELLSLQLFSRVKQRHTGRGHQVTQGLSAHSLASVKGSAQTIPFLEGAWR